MPAHENDVEDTKNDSPPWPQEDIQRLLDRMLEFIPKDDHRRYNTMVDNLPWAEIRFDNYSADECYYTWKFIVRRVRKFRLLREVIEDCNKWLLEPWTSYYASKKKNQHPDRPKMPPNSFMVFCEERRQKVKSENPNMTMPERTKLIKEAYNNLSPKKKAKYVKKSELRKQEYQRKMEIFLTENPLQEKKKRNISASKEITAFNAYFENETRSLPEKNEKSYKNILPDIENQWASLPESEKIIWMKAASKKKKSSQKALKTDENDGTNQKNVRSIKEQHDLFTSLGMPAKPPASIYTMFTKTILKSGELENFETKARMQQVSERWKTITTEEKQQLQEKLSLDQKEYKEKCSAFLASLGPDKRAEFEVYSNLKKKQPNKRVNGETATNKKKKNTNPKKEASEKEEMVVESVNEETPTNKEKKNTNSKKEVSETEEMVDGRVNKETPKIRKKKNSNPKKEDSEKEEVVDERGNEETPTNKKKKNSNPKKEESEKEEMVDEKIDGETPRKKHKKKRNYIEIEEPVKEDVIVPEKIDDETPRKKRKKTKTKPEMDEPTDEIASNEKIDDETPSKKQKKSRTNNGGDETINKTYENDESIKIKKKKKKTPIEENHSELKKSDADLVEEPKAPPRDVMELFSETMKKANKLFTASELSDEWENLSKKEKKRYNKELDKMKEVYISEFELFLNSLPTSKLQKYL